MRTVITLFALLFATLTLDAQSNLQPDPPHREWKASWVTHPTAPLREPVVLHFRRMLSLATVPATYPVRVSADNRFILYVNGHRAGDGPRGDLAHWRYERFDLALLLQPGQNLFSYGVELRRLRADRTDKRPHSFSAGEPGPPATTPSAPRRAGWSSKNRASVVRSSSTLTWPPVPAKRSMPRSTTGAGTIPCGQWAGLGRLLRRCVGSVYPTANKAHSAGDSDRPNAWALVPDELPHMELS